MKLARVAAIRFLCILKLILGIPFSFPIITTIVEFDITFSERAVYLAKSFFEGGKELLARSISTRSVVEKGVPPSPQPSAEATTGTASNTPGTPRFEDALYLTRNMFLRKTRKLKLNPTKYFP